MITQTVPAKYQLSGFEYALDESLIAQSPLANRDQARLMVLNRQSGRIEHRVFTSLVEYLQPSDVVVLNNTKVVPARLQGRKNPGGGQIHILLLRRTSIPAQWEALVRGSVSIGQRIEFGDGLDAVPVEDLGEGRKILELSGPEDLDAALDRQGTPPLPPYIRRNPVPEDRAQYQTVYASARGSVAAPTSGFHFTERLLDKIRAKGVTVLQVTLHIGRGTFQPVRSEDIREHRMESEWYEIGPTAAEELERARRDGRKIIAIGTTATRVLESGIPEHGPIRPCSGWTHLFITPGYSIKMIDALVTNFHLPRSTLMMLVSAFAGRENIQRAYAEATASRYRFLSYGDAMLIR